MRRGLLLHVEHTDRLKVEEGFSSSFKWLSAHSEEYYREFQESDTEGPENLKLEGVCRLSALMLDHFPFAPCSNDVYGTETLPPTEAPTALTPQTRLGCRLMFDKIRNSFYFRQWKTR
jgi:hypothetical protein